MNRLLIVYATSEGQTAHVAEFMAGNLRERGFEVEIAELGVTQPNPRDFDAVLVGGSVHAGKFQAELQAYVGAYREALERVPAWFFATSLSEGIESPPFGRANAQLQIDRFLEAAHWRPRGTASIAGAIKYRDYPWPKRLLMKNILGKHQAPTDTSRNYEYTNWEGVREFTAQVAEQIAQRRPELVG
jgi:menaquinone-dependent protoporphyrinogen oxidase